MSNGRWGGVTTMINHGIPFEEYLLSHKREWDRGSIMIMKGTSKMIVAVSGWNGRMSSSTLLECISCLEVLQLLETWTTIQEKWRIISLTCLLVILSLEKLMFFLLILCILILRLLIHSYMLDIECKYDFTVPYIVMTHLITEYKEIGHNHFFHRLFV